MKNINSHIRKSAAALAHYVLLFTACMVAACSNEEMATVADNSLSFTRPAFILPAGGTVDVTLELNHPATRSLAVPFTVGGTAVEGEDFEMDATQFQFNAGDKTASVQLTSLGSFNNDRQVELLLNDNVEGYELGFIRKTVVPIQAQPVLAGSFNKAQYELKTEVEVALTLKSGSKSVTYANYEVPFEVAPTSTAVLGTHFEIVGGKQVLTMTKNTSSALATIRFLKKEEGKDQIVLRLADSPYFIQGSGNTTTTITISGPTKAAELVGTWTCQGLTNAQAIKEAAQLVSRLSDADVLPDNCPATDKITFTDNGDGTLSLDASALTGDLAKYLRNATYSIAEEKEEELWETNYNLPEKGSVVTMNVSLVNYFFSATEISERSAQVGFRLLDKGKTLEMRIYQYQPKDFLPLSYQAKAADTYSGRDVMKRGFTLIYQFKK